jgi:hypothetical protein
MNKFLSSNSSFDDKNLSKISIWDESVILNYNITSKSSEYVGKVSV